MGTTKSMETRLKSKKEISFLFERGSTFSSGPIKVFFSQNKESKQLNRSAFSVGKKTHPNAVDRNKIKRQMRSCYKNNKYLVTQDCGFSFLFLYLKKGKADFNNLNSNFVAVLKKINKKNND